MALGDWQVIDNDPHFIDFEPEAWKGGVTLSYGRVDLEVTLKMISFYVLRIL